jgi:hypothetical protein
VNGHALVHAELRELFLPAIRPDYQIATSHRVPVNAAIDAPVAYYGNQDKDIDEKSVSAWSAVTKSAFAARRFEGGHFYLVEHAEDLIADLLSHLRVYHAVTCAAGTAYRHAAGRSLSTSAEFSFHPSPITAGPSGGAVPRPAIRSATWPDGIPAPAVIYYARRRWASASYSAFFCGIR